MKRKCIVLVGLMLFSVISVHTEDTEPPVTVIGEWLEDPWLEYILMLETLKLRQPCSTLWASSGTGVGISGNMSCGSDMDGDASPDALDPCPEDSNDAGGCGVNPTEEEKMADCIHATFDESLPDMSNLQIIELASGSGIAIVAASVNSVTGDVVAGTITIHRQQLGEYASDRGITYEHALGYVILHEYVHIELRTNEGEGETATDIRTEQLWSDHYGVPGPEDTGFDAIGDSHDVDPCPSDDSEE